jgi:hypothetical protein
MTQGLTGEEALHPPETAVPRQRLIDGLQSLWLQCLIH